MKLKTLILCASLSLALAVPVANAQTPPTLPATTMSDQPTLGKIVDTTWAALKSGQSNVWYAAYYMHAPSLEKKSGFGIGMFWPVASLGSTNVSANLLAGTRIDYVNGGFWMPSGNVTVEVPIKVLAWTGVSWLQDFAIVPIGYVGIGVPLSGAKVGNFSVPGSIHNNNGDPTAIVGAGFAARIAHWKNMKLDAVYDRETWSGFSGKQDRLGIALNIQR